MRTRRSQAAVVNPVYVRHYVGARELKTYAEDHPIWTDPDPAVWADEGVVVARLFPPEDATTSRIREVVAGLRQEGIVAKVMPRERAAVDPATAAFFGEPTATETVRDAVRAVLCDMSERVKLSRCTWVEVDKQLDEQLGRAGL